MRAALAVVLLGACAAGAPVMTPDHPADPAAKPGRLVGPPAIVRAAPKPAPDEPAPAHDDGSKPEATGRGHEGHP